MMASVCVADDDGDLRTIYSAALRADGHEVFEAADGAEALRRVRDESPSLLLLDLWMPGLDGFEVLEALRNVESGTRTKVIVLSAAPDADSRLGAYGAGAAEVLVKGLPLAELRACVRRALEPEESS